MDPLAYLGAGLSPRTMPAAIPGAVGTPPGAQGRPMPPPPGTMPPPGAIPGLPTPFMAANQGPQDPGDVQYKAITQSDGSVLLHMLNPDGSVGPAVKIISGVGPKQAGLK